MKGLIWGVRDLGVWPRCTLARKRSETLKEEIFNFIGGYCWILGNCSSIYFKRIIKKNYFVLKMLKCRNNKDGFFIRQVNRDWNIICLSLLLSFSLSLSFSPSVLLSLCLSLLLSFSLSLSLSPSVFLSLCPSLSLPFSLSVFLSLSIFLSSFLVNSVRSIQANRLTGRQKYSQTDTKIDRQNLREQFVDSEIVSGLQKIFLFGLQIERRFCFVRFGGTETPRSENNVSRTETPLAKKAQHCGIENKSLFKDFNF